MVQSGQSPTAHHVEPRDDDSGSGIETFQSNANEAVDRALARRHGTVSAFGETEAAKTDHSPLGSPNSVDESSLVSFAPQPRPARPTATLHPLQEWEGYVVGIEGDYVVARLVDLTAGDSQESEEAVIPLAEISEHDASRIVVGSIFRWVIGHERSVDGTRRRVSRIVFRDLPRMTRRDCLDGQDWMRSVVSAFDQ